MSQDEGQAPDDVQRIALSAAGVYRTEKRSKERVKGTPNQQDGQQKTWKETVRMSGL